MAKSNKKRLVIDKVLTSFGVAVMATLVAIGAVCWWASSFVSSNVQGELASQKIFFPAQGSPAIAALPAEDQVQMSKYAGQQLLTGDQAKVYADNFIAVHLSEIAGGKTYAEVSTAAQAQPNNAKLQGQANILFKGETLRGLLLGDAYAFGTVGHIARVAAVVAFVAAGVMAVLVLLGLRHMTVL